MRRVGVVLGLTALAIVVLAGCRKHHRRHGHGGDDRGAPEAYWPAAQMTVNEGSQFTIVLTLDQVWDAPVVIALTSSDTARVTLPASVTFPTGVTAVNVTLTTMADSDSTDTLVQVHAESLLDVNSMGIVLRETSAALGGALGPVPAGPNRALLVTDGPDGIWATPDDTLAVASGVAAGVPTLTHVTIGAVTPGPQALPVLTGVSDSALVQTNGPDLTLGTSDDTLVQVGGISGATPSVTASLAVGRMEASEGRRPVMVGSTAVFLTRGADLLTNGDDELAMIGGVGTVTLTMTTFPAPGVAFEAPSLVAVVDASTVALHLTGPDFIFDPGPDDVSVITGIGAVPAVLYSAPITTLFDGRMGVPVAINGTTVVVVSVGADLIPGTVDDRFAAIRDLFLVPTATPLVVGPMRTDPDAQAVAVGSDAILFPMRGLDLADFTADDQVALVLSLTAGALPPPVLLAAGNPAPGPGGRIVALSSTDAVQLSTGVDGALGTGDDGLTVLTSLSGAGASSTFPTGPLQSATPLQFSSTSVALSGEGVDALPGTPDDEIIRVSGIGTSTAADSAFPGTFRLSGPGCLVPDGPSFAYLARTTGTDAAPGTSDDLLSTSPLP